MQSRGFTKRARSEQFAIRMEEKFRASVKAMADKELTEVSAHLAGLLEKTPKRHIWVIDRLQYKLAVCRQEIAYRDEILRSSNANGRVQTETV